MQTLEIPDSLKKKLQPGEVFLGRAPTGHTFEMRGDIFVAKPTIINSLRFNADVWSARLRASEEFQRVRTIAETAPELRGLSAVVALPF